MTDLDLVPREWRERYRSRVRGCLLGGAVGDALGAPVEFQSWPEIRDAHGPHGLRDLLLADGGQAPVTDDTQLTLFTVEGLIRASVRSDRGVCHPPSVVYRAYLRWLETQRSSVPPPTLDGWIAGQSWLYAQRAPGNACLSGLRGDWMGTPERPQNPGSKGCGAVMRSAPFGLVPHATPGAAFDLAAECATQTHGHPSGYLAAGALAAIVRCLLDEHDLRDAVGVTLDLLAGQAGDEEVTGALRNAIAPAQPGRPPEPADVERHGGGWVAEEALGIAVFCALAFRTRIPARSVRRCCWPSTTPATVTPPVRSVATC